MQPLPKEFEEQMKRLLGEAGFFAYLNALDEPYTRALRINLAPASGRHAALRHRGAWCACSVGKGRVFHRGRCTPRAFPAP